MERTCAWLHQFKRLQIHYAIRADLHLSLLQLACGITCLRDSEPHFETISQELDWGVMPYKAGGGGSCGVVAEGPVGWRPDGCGLP